MSVNEVVDGFHYLLFLYGEVRLRDLSSECLGIQHKRGLTAVSLIESPSKLEQDSIIHTVMILF